MYEKTLKANPHLKTIRIFHPGGITNELFVPVQDVREREIELRKLEVNFYIVN